MTEWQPIETAPKDGTGFLAFERINDKHHTISVCVWQDGLHGEGPYMVIFHEKENQAVMATHWMPLPEPPQQEAKGFDEYGNYGENNGPV